MNVSDMLIKFRTFAGDERFRKFIRMLNGQCVHDRRLRFWQEKLLDDFSATTGHSIDADVVFSVFRVCDIHETELQRPSSAHVVHEIRDTHEFDIAQSETFPFAIGALVCQDCYDVYSEWVVQHDDLCRVLRRKTTYTDYCARRLKDLPSLLADSKHKIAQREAEIATEMEPGDELWEWDAGGWHRLAGREGVAIVRDGQIVKQWCEWKS